jgi:hypothetical protein
MNEKTTAKTHSNFDLLALFAYMATESLWIHP